MAFSVRLTLVAAVALTWWRSPDAPRFRMPPSAGAHCPTRLAWAPLTMILMGLAGFATARLAAAYPSTARSGDRRADGRIARPAPFHAIVSVADAGPLPGNVNVVRRARHRLPVPDLHEQRPAQQAHPRFGLRRDERRRATADRFRPRSATAGAREGITRLDAVLYTHFHADQPRHRRPQSLQRLAGRHAAVLRRRRTGASLRERFAYAFAGTPWIGLIPHIGYTTVDASPFYVGKTCIQPIPMRHGSIRATGYRIGISPI